MHLHKAIFVTQEKQNFEKGHLWEHCDVMAS